MLPDIHMPERDFQQQPHREEVNVAAPNIPRADLPHRNSIFNNISATIATSPKFFAQESLVKTLGNNMVTQGIMQVGGLLGSVIDRLSGADMPDGIPSSNGPGLSELDRSVLREMLRTLLRIEDNTSGIGSGVVQPMQQPEPVKTVFRPVDTGKFDYKPQQKPTPKVESVAPTMSDGRKSAEDVLARLNQKNPVAQRDPTSNILREHYGDIEQNIANTAAMGVYNVLGYNVLSQGIVDTASLVGDLSSRLLTKSPAATPTTIDSTTTPANLDYTSKSAKSMFEKIIGRKTEDAVPVEKKDSEIGAKVDYTSKKSKELFEKVTGSSAEDLAPHSNPEVVEEIRQSNTILHDMLDGINEMNDAIQNFYGGKDISVSDLENELEAKQKRPLTVDSKTEPKVHPQSNEVKPEEKKEGDLLSTVADAAGDLLSGGGKKGIMGKLGNLARFMPSAGTLATVGAAAAPLALMGYAAHKAGDQTHDIENVEDLKETSSGLSGLLKKFGLDFGDRFEKQAAKNREGLDTTAELEAMKKPSNANSLEKTADKADELASKKQSVFGEGLKQQISNITNINSQTVIPSRPSVRNTDSTANRYFDQAMN